MGKNSKKEFKFDNVSLHSFVHSNFSFFFKVAKKWKVLSLAQDKVAKCPISCWIYLRLEGAPHVDDGLKLIWVHLYTSRLT